MTDTSEIQEHYNTLLARNYVWIAGGWDAGCKRFRRFFSDHAIRPTVTKIAVDLGAGSGFSSVVLAEAGFRVTAIDFSAPMLEILKNHAGNLPIKAVHADILSPVAWEKEPPELIICMGDSLTHLPDFYSVSTLIRRCARELTAGGTIILSCRNYVKKTCRFHRGHSGSAGQRPDLSLPDRVRDRTGTGHGYPLHARVRIMGTDLRNLFQTTGCPGPARTNAFRRRVQDPVQRQRERYDHPDRAKKGQRMIRKG